jgi:hypothetical protein
MQKQTLTIMQLSFLFLVTALVFGCGTTVIASNTEGKSPALKTQSPTSAHSAGAGVSMRVLWTVSEYVIGPNAHWGEKEARQLLFKPLDITATSITFNGKTCRDIITFKKEQIKAKEYLAHAYNTTPQALGIEGETIEVIKTNCNLPGFAEYLRLKDRRLVIQISGVFFYLKPAVNY